MSTLKELNKLKNNTLAEGIGKCLSNVGSLLADADLLFSNKSYCRAVVLYKFSSEELGKAIQLLILLNNRQKTNLVLESDSLKDFLSHVRKGQTSLSLELLIFGLLKRIGYFNQKEEFFHSIMNYYQKENNMRHELNSLKNEMLYVSWDTNNFYTPNELLDIETVEVFGQQIKFRFEMHKVFYETVLGELLKCD